MLITDDIELRKYIPNTLISVQGEQSLFDKLQFDLQLSERWLARHVGSAVVSTANDLVPSQSFGSDNPSNDYLIKKIIATDAFLRAVPSLDLILTPNGFGIVSNNTISPASKERVDRLLSSLEQNRDFALDQLLQTLLQNNYSVGISPALGPSQSFGSDNFRTTPQGQYFLSTLFQTPLSLPKELHKNHALDYFEQVHPQLVLIENELADKFISHAVYQRLHQNITDPSLAILIQPLQAIELQLLQGKPLPYKQLITLVDYIRTHADTFPEWQTSPTAELYQSNSFQNTKSAAGFWW